jgi:hypothetical protein
MEPHSDAASCFWVLTGHRQDDDKAAEPPVLKYDPLFSDVVAGGRYLAVGMAPYNPTASDFRVPADRQQDGDEAAQLHYLRCDETPPRALVSRGAQSLQPPQLGGKYNLSKLNTIMPPFAYMYKTPCFNMMFFLQECIYACMNTIVHMS